MTAQPTTRSSASHRTPRDLTVMIVSRVPGSGLIQQGLALTAVQRDERAVHEARALGGDEDGDVGDFLRRADPTEGNAALGPLLRLVDADLADLGDAADQVIPPLGGYRARIDRVDADVVL